VSRRPRGCVYRAAGADPAKYLYVGQGSFRADDPVPASGTTHNGGGAADLRVWNLPDAVQANLCEKLVRELRRRGGCAWFRDEEHGGFVADESPPDHVRQALAARGGYGLRRAP
jgi:hypothetical protein